MTNIWEEVRLDNLSFWLGFVLGLLVLGIFIFLIPRLRLTFQWISTKIHQVKSRATENIEWKYRQELIQFTRRLHLAAPLFPLDEIFIEPRFFFPPSPQSEEDDIFADLADIILPYLPDWPELAAFYQGRSIPMKHILDSEANIAIIGHPGTGKSVALAGMASILAERDKRSEKISKRLPILIHAADLISGEQTEIRPCDRIINLVQSQFPRINSPRLKTLIYEQIKTGDVVLLLDGYDELSPSGQMLASKLISTVLDDYPGNRVIVAADVLDFSGLRNLPIIPITISPWNAHQRREFLAKWINNWRRISAIIGGDHLSEEDEYLFTSWLMNDSPFTTPLETMFKVWAVTAGDLSSPSPLECIEHYIQRFLSNNQQPAEFQELAIRMISNLSLSWDLRKNKDISSSEDTAPGSLSQTSAIITSKRGGKIKSLKITGLLSERPSGLVSFLHPVITCYLAAAALSRTPITHYFEIQPDWIGKRLTLGFLIGLGIRASDSMEILERDRDPFFRPLLTASRWLRYTPKDANFRPEIMKFLSEEVQQPDHTKGLRLRLLAALLCSQDSGLNILFRTMVKSPHPGVRLAGVLGLGFIKDQASIPLIGELVADDSPGISEAACLALSTIGTKHALNLLGTAFLSREEKIAVNTAIALAFNFPDGHDMLKEASRMEDFLIRRAAIYGLVRIPESWAREIIEDLALNDDQWLVRDIASQAIAYKKSQLPNPIKPLPELAESAWLIEFASSKGLGVSPGKSAKQMLHAVLKVGTPVQRRSALEYLRLNGDAEFIPEIIECAINSDDLTRDVAYDVIWHNLAMGLKYPLKNL